MLSDYLADCLYPGAGVFQQKTEDVIIKYSTPITPPSWLFFVWDFVYLWIFAMFIYFLVGLCRRFAPPAPSLMLFTHNLKEADNALELRHSAEHCLFFP